LLQDKEFESKLIKQSQETDSSIIKARKETREIYEHKANIISMKSALKKQDQEDNLKRIQLQFQKDKRKLIEKIKETEINGRGKSEINLKKLKKEATNEFKTRLSPHI
jgi:hypothetical protein